MRGRVRAGPPRSHRWHGRTRIDHEQKVARLDHVAFLEGDAVDIAADAWAYVDRADGRDPPSEFVPLAYRFGHDLDGIDLGRRRRRGFRLAVAASGDYGGHDHHGNGGKTRTRRREQGMAVWHERPLDWANIKVEVNFNFKSSRGRFCAGALSCY